MASTQELLQAISNLQPNAQAALPVLPNNGNPGGAYNAPNPAAAPAPVSTAQPSETVVAPKNNLSWMQPSQSMNNIRNMLASRQQMLNPVQPATVTQAPPTVPPVENPNIVLPQRVY